MQFLLRYIQSWRSVVLSFSILFFIKHTMTHTMTQNTYTNTNTMTQKKHTHTQTHTMIQNTDTRLHKHIHDDTYTITQTHTQDETHFYTYRFENYFSLASFFWLCKRVFLCIVFMCLCHGVCVNVCVIV